VTAAFEDYLETLADGIEQNGYGIAQKSVTSNLGAHRAGIPIQLHGQMNGPRIWLNMYISIDINVSIKENSLPWDLWVFFQALGDHMVGQYTQTIHTKEGLEIKGLSLGYDTQ